MNPPLTADDIQTIQAELDKQGGRIRPAVRALKAAGTPFSQGSVHNVAHGKTGSAPLPDAARLAAANAKVRVLQSRNTRLLQELGQTLELKDDLLAAIEPVTPYPRAPRPSKRRVQKPRSAVLLLSDHQIGEVINPDEMLGINAYNYATAESRMARLVNSFGEWVEVERAGHWIPELVICLLGDLISGDIHREFSVTNEFPVPVAIVKSAQLLAKSIAPLASQFDRVVIHEICADNHARKTQKTQFKQRGLNSENYVLFNLLNAYLGRHKNVEPVLHPYIKAQVQIAGNEVLLEHGNDVRAWMGIPYYGMMRMEGREAIKRMHTPKLPPYTEHLMGHWHVAALGPFGIVNGSLCGTSEFDMAAGRFAPPSQVSFLVHPKWGVFNWVRWNLSES